MEGVKVQHFHGDLKKPSHLPWGSEDDCKAGHKSYFLSGEKKKKIILFKVNNLYPEEGNEVFSINLTAYFLRKVETYLPIFLECVSCEIY